MRKDAAGDHLLLSSDDPSCFADVARTKDWRYITLNLNTKTSSEVGTPLYPPPPLCAAELQQWAGCRSGWWMGRNREVLL